MSKEKEKTTIELEEVKEELVEFGKVSLPKRVEKTPYVPTLLPYSNKDLLELLAFSVKADMPALLIGETGVGKTASIRHLAAVTNNSLRRVNVNGSMTAEDFLGQNLVRPVAGGGNETYWKDGVLTECIRNGYWIVIDEINAAPPEVLFALHSLLDDDRYIVLTDHPQRELVKAHKDFRVFATMNPPERYAGTQAVNKALLSRFGLTVNVPVPPPSIEYGLLSGADKSIDKDEVKQLKSFVSELRSSYTREDLDVFISPRDVAHIVKLYAFFGSMSEAIKHTIMPRGTTAEKEAIEKLSKLHFADKSPKGEAPAGGAQSLKAGDKVYFVKKDGSRIVKNDDVFSVEYEQDSKLFEGAYIQGPIFFSSTAAKDGGKIKDIKGDFALVQYQGEEANGDEKRMCLAFPLKNLIAID